MSSRFMLAHRGDLGVLDAENMVGEPKLDGTRCHIIKTPTGLEMWSRNSKDNTYRVNYAELHNLPEVEHDAKDLDCRSAWLDVELVWYNKHGRSVMRGSQVRCGTKSRSAVLEKMRIYPINAMAFDLLELNGEDLTKEPFVVRKAMLKGFLSQHKQLDSLRYVDYTFNKWDLWEHTISIGGEGLMAKTLMGIYEFRRSRSWLKLKNERTAVKQVVGYTLGEGARAPYFGSLVLANEDGSYCGNVGSGFDTEELEWWTRQLTSVPHVEKPFPYKEVGDRYIAVNLPFKVKVRYFEETPRGILRFPVYVEIAK